MVGVDGEWFLSSRPPVRVGWFRWRCMVLELRVDGYLVESVWAYGRTRWSVLREADIMSRQHMANVAARGLPE